ncbi:hypothetical protein VOLCADRAFT_76178 [Volvox carteri f. nagariensis]|uniref:S1 motif domain-containing protein n=1 Tax=Volvox carteri f. nagariensis TaxID=3068 RepID=D8U6D1_VOLCA|nr:uncharacterized protein VOLCADRAFT_76178 [Volvox carteri f. nagariensis]EFJ44695.1 hypothetical protein VOLCADRAFT_76178 [Volvox carteri f. nagariensis]|eukprot:XP_002954271.1 hypothetical protein VOLCADRAFT_76178 [Volvox carteri f. nagariensis]
MAAAGSRETPVCAGDRLGTTDLYEAGEGVYVRDGFLFAGIVGLQHIEQPAGRGAKPVLGVVPRGIQPLVPKPGDLVTVKISRVAQTAAMALVLCVGRQALSTEFKGVIRQQDVRATEIDRVVMYDCFRPGDIVRAEVVSLGDARSYYLSTAKNELGVVYARSAAAGVPLVPTGWVTMMCPETRTVEKRKVARLGAAGDEGR